MSTINSGLIGYLTPQAQLAVTNLVQLGYDTDLAIEILEVAVKNGQLKENEVYQLLEDPTQVT